MEIKFILLIIGLFIFTLGYVNQNKYNCNIIPSLDRYQEQDLKKLFYKDDIFLDEEKFVGARPQKLVINNSEFISQLPSGGQAMEYGSNTITADGNSQFNSYGG